MDVSIAALIILLQGGAQSCTLSASNLLFLPQAPSEPVIPSAAGARDLLLGAPQARGICLWVRHRREGSAFGCAAGARDLPSVARDLFWESGGCRRKAGSSLR